MVSRCARTVSFHAGLSLLTSPLLSCLSHLLHMSRTSSFDMLLRNITSFLIHACLERWLERTSSLQFFESSLHGVAFTVTPFCLPAQVFGGRAWVVLNSHLQMFEDPVTTGAASWHTIDERHLLSASCFFVYRCCHLGHCLPNHVISIQTSAKPARCLLHFGSLTGSIKAVRITPWLSALVYALCVIFPAALCDLQDHRICGRFVIPPLTVLSSLLHLLRCPLLGVSVLFHDGSPSELFSLCVNVFFHVTEAAMFIIVAPPWHPLAPLWRTRTVRITVFSSAIVIDVIVHCHTAGAF